MVGTVKDLAIILLLMGLLIYMYILVGQELFAYKSLTGTNIESNFDGLLNSFLTVFIIFSNDGWSQIYLKYYQVSGFFSSTVYFFSLLIIGQYIVINLLEIIDCF